MTKILILTIGSRGDVQPYIALAKGLVFRGHTVRLASLNKFSGLVAEAGLEFAPLDAGLLPIFDTPEGREAVRSGLIRNAPGLYRRIKPILFAILDNAWAAAGGMDLIIFQPLALAGHSIAEKLEIPGIIALPSPLLSPTTAFASPYFPVPFDLGWLNRISHQLVIGASLPILRRLINPWRRKRLNLGPAGDQRFLYGRHILKLYGYSAHVLPIPEDWDAYSQVTGYWFLDSDKWQPPQDLIAFLNNGPPPVYVGFGSVTATDADRLTHLVLQAGRIAQQRLVLATGWGALSPPAESENIYTLQAAPHDWLFPRMAAVVHHGGAGTTAAGLRAGKPTVICPFSSGQLFWGQRVAALGAGPGVMPHKRLTAERLAEAMIEAVSNPLIRQRANELGERIRLEDGVGKAVEVIEKYAGLS